MASARILLAKVHIVEEFVSEILRRLEEKDMSVSELARRAGVSRPYLHNVLSGEHCPSLGFAQKIGDVVGVKIVFVTG